MNTINAQNRVAELGKFFASLKDRPLEPDDAAYVADLHRVDGNDPIADLAAQILWDQGGGTYLFTGQRGTGKSTELRRLRRALRQQGCTVLLLDMGDYLLETEPVEVGDFVISLAGALSDAIAAEYGAPPARNSYWERAAAFLQTDVQIKGIDAIGLKFELKGNPTFKERVQAASRDRLSALVRDARDYAREILAFLQARHGADTKLVLIVDSVERLRGVNAEGAKRVFDSAVTLFSGNPDYLRFPPLHVVYSVPPYLSALTANLSALYSGQMVFLASAHVFDEPGTGSERRPSATGLKAMRELVERRYAAWREVFAETQLDTLALASGGDIRDYFRLVSSCLVKARDPQVQLPIDARVLTEVKNAMRREMLPIPDDDKDWLKEIAISHSAQLKSMDRLSTLARFLDTRLVLNYRNGRDWYDVHPLLWEVIDEHDASRESGTRRPV
jgi:hypothetical protein